MEELGFGLRPGSVPAGRVNAADAHGLTLRAELETEHSYQRQRKPGRCEPACLSFPHLYGEESPSASGHEEPPAALARRDARR